MRPRIRPKALGLVAIAVSAAIIGTGCTGGGGSASTDTIRTRLGADPTTFDPAKLTAGDDFYISRLLFDTVLRYDDSGKIVGGLASSWDLNSNGGSITVKDGATCGDGTPITAKVIADSLTRFASPDTKSSYKTLVFGNGNPTITAADDKTVQIQLSKPFSELAAGLTTTASGIVCPTGLADTGSLAEGGNAGGFSGPYTLAAANHGVNYDLKLRDGYSAWPDFIQSMSGRPATNITFSVGEDYATNANELQGGSLDVAQINSTDTNRFQNVSKVINGEQYVVFNQAEGSPFKDEKLRAAVAQVLSPDSYNQVTYNGESETELTVGDSGMQCANKDASLLQTYDPDSVAKSGVLKGVKIKYVASNGFGPNGAGSEYVYQQLKAAGAEVDYQLLDNSSWASIALGKDNTKWDLTLFGTVNQTGTLWTSVSRILGTPIEDGGRSMTRADNPEGVALADAVMSSNTDDEKCENYQKLQANFLTRVDVVPLTASTYVYGVRKGFQFNAPNSRMDLTTLRIDS